ncbi:hypothetical protein DDB_G0290549 [Dictyostelium discoideum AX4]|uniref:Uncharacterized protein n=1 Tax=Dictyostelium discoideum TaxID=44689 RepID=Q54FX3_DICDI|nr:hypothetical protein DDB_G0290549 [Dictyostelium discoideum AX4]EAL62135.1 hypothetical protein DDB_G0290549 [Dictyostelium discoideum AX4]|eukprot:XP_635644.1 hypothetical protein DDB_G0290549 [Dictyostelium discoideum AX4]
MEPIPSLIEFDELYKENLFLKKQINQYKVENEQLKYDKNQMKKSLEKARLIIVEQRKKIISPPPIVDSFGNVQISTPSSTISSPSIGKQLQSQSQLQQQINKQYQDSTIKNISNETLNNNNNNNNNNNINNSNDFEIEINLGSSKKSSPMIKSFSLPSINIPFFSFQNNNNNNNINKLKQFDEEEQIEIEYPIESISTTPCSFNSECSTPNGSVSIPFCLSKSLPSIATNLNINNNNNNNNTNNTNNNNGILLETIKNMLKKNKDKTKEQELLIRQLKQQNTILLDLNNSFKERTEILEKKVILNKQQLNNNNIKNDNNNNNQNNNINNFNRSPSKLLNNIRLSPLVCSSNIPNNNTNNNKNNNNNNKNKQQQNDVQLEVIVL